MGELCQAVYARKSTRHFDQKLLDESVLKGIYDFIPTVKPFNPSIKTACRIVGPGSIRGLSLWRAPHYLVVFSQPRDGYLTNIGFMYEQVVLYLQSLGLGTCWLGEGRFKPKRRDFDIALDKIAAADLDFVIMIAFGHAADDDVSRTPDDFDRLDLSDISDSRDRRLEPARLAPSSNNSQPWYFVHKFEEIHAYRKNPGVFHPRNASVLNQIDMGVALAHLYVCNPETFSFVKTARHPSLAGKTYVASFTL